MRRIKTAIKKIRAIPGMRKPYLLLRLLNSGITDRPTRAAILGSRFNRGYCSICEKGSFFVERTEWLRDDYFCIDCYSIPRQRAILHLLQQRFPEWCDLVIHESAAGGQSSDKLAAECSRYTSSQFMPDIEPGEMRGGVRCEDLESLTFANDSFDLFVTQDVFEHVLDPARAFREVARVLRPGGSHVFTVPLYQHETSLIRARRGGDGEIVNFEEPDYHGDPGVGAGWLVATEWGKDLTKFIEDASGLKTDIIATRDPKLGLMGEFLDVFVSTKAN